MDSSTLLMSSSTGSQKVVEDKEGNRQLITNISHIWYIPKKEVYSYKNNKNLIISPSKSGNFKLRCSRSIQKQGLD